MQRAKVGPLPPARGFAGTHRAVANKEADTRPWTMSGRSAVTSVAAPAATEMPTMTAGPPRCSIPSAGGVLRRKRKLASSGGKGRTPPTRFMRLLSDSGIGSEVQ